MSYSKNHKIETFMKLAVSESLLNGKFKDFLSELTPSVCESLDAHKTSFSLYREENDEFERIQSFDKKVNEQLVGKGLNLTQFPSLVKLLKNEQFVLISRTDSDSDREEFILDYLVKNRLTSWASFQVWNDNRLFGIVTVEWESKKEFGSEDQLILLAATSMISQCYDALLRLKEDFLHRNELSTLKIEEKEKEKLAKKLSDHAFYTSHTIRHPLSTILALIDLIKLNWESRETYEELLQQLKLETMNLDDAIRVMTAKIELD